jgi:RNA polymerase sigma factor (TIGR02999 family)
MITSIHSFATPAHHDAPVAADALFATLYDELHRMARRELSRRSDSGGLGVTTLLHEAYLAISDREGALFPDRVRFMAYAARVMRGLIIDDLRGRLAHKRGGGMPHTTLITDIAQDLHDVPTLERISDALDELATHDASLAELVDLKFFCGFSFVEIAAMRGVSERTVKRSWEKSRIYLHRALGGAGGVSRVA